MYAIELTLDRGLVQRFQIIRLGQGDQTLPGLDLIHRDQEALTAGLLTFARIFCIHEGYLFHWGSTRRIGIRQLFHEITKSLLGRPKGAVQNISTRTIDAQSLSSVDQPGS